MKSLLTTILVISSISAFSHNLPKAYKEVKILEYVDELIENNSYEMEHLEAQQKVEFSTHLHLLGDSLRRRVKGNSGA